MPGIILAPANSILSFAGETRMAADFPQVLPSCFIIFWNNSLSLSNFLVQIVLQVLMQTRCDKVRPRILGLRIVKYLLEKLKEEYLVLVAETIPFLGELLEDVELPVKSLAQEILKEMESMSGESLRQYL